MDMYTSQVNSNPEAGMRAYLDEFFTSPKSWNEYLNRIGLDHLLAAGKGGRSVFND
jgi:hypothetical protein